MKNIGSPGELESIHATFDTQVGRKSESTYRGSQQYIRSLNADFMALGYRTACDFKPGLCSLTVHNDKESGGDDDFSIGVEVSMQINRVHKSIYEPPSLGLSAEELGKVQRAVNAALNSEHTQAEIVALTDELSNDGVILFNLGVRKVEHRVVNQPILTKVTTGGRQHQFPAGAHDGVGENYSAAAMLSELGITLQFPLPIFTEPLDSDIYYGWLKQMPSYSQVAGQRVSETVTFEFGAWSIDLYPLVG